jgi:peptidyl-prolyl cis-trans isomerase D
MFMVRRKFEQDYSAKKFSALKMSNASFLKKAKEQGVSEKDIVSFFKTHEQDYRVPEKRDAVAWEFSPASYGIAVSDAEIKNYYESNKSKFVASPSKIRVRRILFKTPNEESLMAARVKAEAVYNELTQKPELFAQKATAVSEDATTAKNGGLVDFFSRGERDSNFEKAAFRLQKDGDVSPLIQTESGLEILQRVERKASTFKPLSAVSADIRDTLTKQLFKKRFEADSEKIFKDGTGEQAVVAFAKKHQAKRTELKKIEYNDSLQGEMLFKLKDGFAHYHDKDKGVILQLSAVHKSFIPTLDTIKSQVVADLYKVKAERDLLTSLDQAKQKANKESLTKVAQGYGATVESLGWLKNEKTAELEKLSKQGIPVAQMLQMEKAGSLLAYYDGNQAYLLRLDEVESVKDKELASKAGGITKDLARTNATVALDGFVASLIRNATLKTYEEAVNLNDFDTTA